MNPWFLALLIVLFTTILLLYVAFTYIALKSAVHSRCIQLCREGATGCVDINGLRCCIGTREPGAVNVDANCQPIV